MTDSLLAPTDIQDALLNVYADAIAAGAGYVTARQNFDRDGVDIQFRAGGSMLPSMDAQLKATINLGQPDQDGVFKFPLKKRNYDYLILQTTVPRILIVYDMPTDQQHWMTTTNQAMILKRCAYWTSLRGLDATENKESVTVSIPEVNRFDVEALRRLMDQARSGVINAC
jgi:hypothetical protein